MSEDSGPQISPSSVFQKLRHPTTLLSGGLGVSGAAVIWMFQTFPSKADYRREIDEIKTQHTHEIDEINKRLIRIEEKQDIILYKLKEGLE